MWHCVVKPLGVLIFRSWPATVSSITERDQMERIVNRKPPSVLQPPRVATLPRVWDIHSDCAARLNTTLERVDAAINQRVYGLCPDHITVDHQHI